MNRKSACKATIYLFMLLAAACIVVASCLLANYPVAAYCLFGGAAAMFVAQLLAATGFTFAKSQNKVNGFEQWGICWMVTAICLAIVALLPVVLIMLIVDAIVRHRMNK